MNETAADIINRTLAALEYDGVRWTREPGGSPTNAFGETHPAKPIEAGWTAVEHDGTLWVIVDTLDADPASGEKTRTFSCARVTTVDLRPDLATRYLTDGDVHHVSPPEQRTIGEVVERAAGVYAQRMKRRAAVVDDRAREVLFVLNRLSSVMEANGWRR